MKSKDLKNPNLMAKQSPYIKIECGKEEFTTRVIPDGGSEVEWNQAFLLNLDGKTDRLSVHVYSKGTVSDDHIGRVDMYIKDLVGPDPKWWQVNDPKNFSIIAGNVLLAAEFKGTGGPVTTPTASASAPAPAPAPMDMPMQVQVQVQPQAPQAQVVVVQSVQSPPPMGMGMEMGMGMGMGMQPTQSQSPPMGMGMGMGMSPSPSSSVPNERQLLNDLLVRAIEIDKANTQALALLRALLTRAK